VRPVVDTYHGVEVVDPYRWLEDLEDPEVLAWMRAQDTHARSVLESIPGVEVIRAELTALRAPSPRRWNVSRSGDAYFFLQANRLYHQEAPHAEPRLIFDGGSPDTANHWIVGYSPAPDLQHVVIEAMDAATERPTLYVLETATSALLPRPITDAYNLAAYANRAWTPDSRSFAYLSRPDSAVERHGHSLGIAYKLHVLGTDPAEDRPIFGYGLSPAVEIPGESWPELQFSPASRYVVAGAGSRIFTAPVDSLNGSRTPWRQVAFPEDSVHHRWAQHGDYLYMPVQTGSPRRRIVRRSLADPAAPAELVLPEGEATIEAFALTSDALFAVLLRDARHELLRVPYDGTTPQLVSLPWSGTVSTRSADLTPDARRPELLVHLGAPDRTLRYLVYDPAAGRVVDTGLETAGPEEAALELQAAHTHAEGADGTRVPLTIVRAAGAPRDGSGPALLYAYATHGEVDHQLLFGWQVPWFRRGGTWAMCHARGSGANGAQWHDDGRRERLPNRVADVVACAEYLIEHGYAGAGRLALWGGSGGGIAIGGALVQRPDLFAAAWLDVPLLDLLRSELRPLGPTHIGEYGSVATPASFRTMHSVSPYDNVREGIVYPAVLFAVGINDPRVPPSDAARMASRLQAATTGNRPVLLRVDWSAGHFTGIPWSERLAFLLWQVGHPDFQRRVH
jgi:prolyl oligopeptidase